MQACLAVEAPLTEPLSLLETLDAEENWSLLTSICFQDGDALASRAPDLLAASARRFASHLAAPLPPAPLLARSTAASRLRRRAGQLRRSGAGPRPREWAEVEPPSLVRSVRAVALAAQGQFPGELPRAPPRGMCRPRSAPTLVERPWRHAQRLACEERGRATWQQVAPDSAPGGLGEEGAPGPPPAGLARSTRSSQALVSLRKTRSDKPACVGQAGWGSEFRHEGLGIGDRFPQEACSPGPGSYECPYGSISLWRRLSSLPAQQPCAKYTSASAHTMGSRHGSKASIAHRHVEPCWVR